MTKEYTDAMRGAFESFCKSTVIWKLSNKDIFEAAYERATAQQIEKDAKICEGMGREFCAKAIRNQGKA